MHKVCFILALLFSCKLFSWNETVYNCKEVKCNSIKENSFLIVKDKPNPLLIKFFKKQSKRKKIIATALAFPIPGGILGAHRIYLGTKPYVPLVYVATLGGGLLILPFIDFCVLLLGKDISRFENNPHVFMWIDNEKKPVAKEEVKTESQ